MCDMPRPSKSMKKEQDDYRAEDDLRTITRAEEVRADASRMGAVRRIQQKQLRALTRVGKALGEKKPAARRGGRRSTR